MFPTQMTKPRLKETREQRLKKREDNSEKHIRELCARDGCSAEFTEKEVAEGLEEVRKNFDENERKVLGLTRLYKVLKSRFVNESSDELGIPFTKLALEIKAHTLSEQELTTLIIELEKNRTLSKEDVEEKLKPFIARNPKYIQQEIEKYRQE